MVNYRPQKFRGLLAPTQYTSVTRLSPAFRVRVWLRETRKKVGREEGGEGRRRGGKKVGREEGGEGRRWGGKKVGREEGGEGRRWGGKKEGLRGTITSDWAVGCACCCFTLSLYLANLASFLASFFSFFSDFCSGGGSTPAASFPVPLSAMLLL